MSVLTYPDVNSGTDVSAFFIMEKVVQTCIKYMYVPVHEIDIDSSPTAELLHEGRGRNGDWGSTCTD